MKKVDILNRFCWFINIIGFVQFLLTGKSYWLILVIIGLATISCLDSIKIKKKDDVSDNLPYIEFKTLYCEIVGFLAFLFLFIWTLMNEKR